MKWMMMLLLSCVTLLAACDVELTKEAVIEEVTQPTPAEPLAAEAGEAMQTFDLAGMTCEGCQETIFHAITDVPGVKRASVSLDETKAWVVSDLDRAVSSDAIVAAVKAKGYEATPASP